MKNIAINATSNFKNVGFGKIKNHVERNYRNDKNVGINPNQTPQNLNLSQANTIDLLRNHYHSLIMKHDKRCGTKHANRKYHNLGGFFKAKGKHKKISPTKMVVSKFGTFNDKTKLAKLTHASQNQLHNADNYGFWLYAKNFNLRHKYFKMGRAITNVDEKGADHIHWELIPLGHTPSGRASMGLSNALKNEYHTTNRTEAMSKFHKQEDPMLISCMNKAYHHFNLIAPTTNFKLHRTGKAFGLNEKVYEKSKIEEDQINKNLRKSNKNLRQLLNSAMNQNAELQVEVKKSSNRNDILDIALHGSSTVPDSLLERADKSAESLVEQNKQLKLKLLNQNQNLKNFINNTLTKLEANNNRIAKTNKGYAQSLASLRNQLRDASKKLVLYQRICSPSIAECLKAFFKEPKTTSEVFYRLIVKKYVKELKQSD